MFSKARPIYVILAILVLSSLILSACAPGLPGAGGVAGMNNGEEGDEGGEGNGKGEGEGNGGGEGDGEGEGEANGLLGDRVWLDANGNGLQEDGEEGVEEIIVRLHLPNGEKVDQALTNGDGLYLFDNTAAGEYTISFDPPGDYGFTLKDAGGDTEDSDVNAETAQTDVFYFDGTEDRSRDAGLVIQTAEEPGEGEGDGDGEGDPTCPLTGLPVEDPSLLALSPVFISISHFPAGATRPSSGLSSAAWVFEMFIGEGQTRLFSLFYCDYPEEGEGGDGDGGEDGDVPIDGVRSGRVFYEDIRRYFSACMIVGGAAQVVADQIQICANAFSTDPSDIGAGTVTVSRLQDIAAQHAANNETPNLTGNVFSYDVPAGGQDAPGFLMFYNFLNQTQWVYNAELGGYVRNQNTPAAPEAFTESTDALTDAPIVRENVIVMFADHTVLNAAGTIIDLNIDYMQGPAVLFRNGMMYRICWDTSNGEYELETGKLRPIRFTDCHGNAFPLDPGYTWINVVDTSTSFYAMDEPGWWMARFYEPSYTP